MAERMGRLHTLIETAFLWGERSTCSRLSVGCVIHREGRILVQGYNGAPAGLPHCDHTCDCPFGLGVDMRDHDPQCKSGPSGCRAVHAEQNAIAWAAREGVSVKGAQLVVTHQPCLSCARSIINAGIEWVFYTETYRLEAGLELLREAGVRSMQTPRQSDRVGA